MSEPRRGPLGRFFAGLWWLLDGSRRLVFNLLFLLVLLALGYAVLFSGPDKLQDKTVLVLDWQGPLVEQQPAQSLSDRVQAQAQGQRRDVTVLRDVLAQLEQAAKDDKIGSALLMLDDFSGAGLPQLREVASAIERFKASGKPVIAWGANYDQRSYFLAAHASQVYLHPMGAVYVSGYGRQRNYWRGALDKLGIEPHVIRAGQYKSFAEVYASTGPSPQAQEAEAFVLDALWADYTGSVEKARKLPSGALMAFINEAPERLKATAGNVAQALLAAKWVDGLKTRDELRELLLKTGSASLANKSTFAQINSEAYNAHVKPQSAAADGVGIVVAEGPISDGEAGPGRVGGLSTAALLRQAREDDKIKAIVLRVNSPGGSAFGSELVRRELELSRAAGKPVVVSMGDVAASGGYWIAMAADEVWADPATVTGSIGVVAVLPTAKALLDKGGVTVAGHSTTWLGKAYDPRTGLDERYAQMMQTLIDGAYSDFKAKVATARKASPEKVETLAQGRIWSGAQALERGLVDRNGGLQAALASAAARAKLNEGAYALRYLDRERTRWQRLLDRFGADALVQPLAAALTPAGLPVLGAGAVSADVVRAMSAAQSALGPSLQADAAFFLAQAQRPLGAGTAALTHCLCAAP